MLTLKVDYREAELIKRLQALREVYDLTAMVEVLVENLPLGDIMFCRDTQEVLLVERKSLHDLAASIRDGRYTEQSFRLNGCSVPNHNIVYLIEGNLTFYKPFKGNNIDKRALVSAMTTLFYFKGFSVQRTQGLDETADWLLMTAAKLDKEMQQNAVPFYGTLASASASAPDAEESNACATATSSAFAPSYTHAVKRVKKDNITAANIAEMMLCQIPQVSANSAQAIMRKYQQSLPLLIEALKSDVHCLDDIQVTEKRRLTKPVINNVFAYLVPTAAGEVNVQCD